MDRDGNIYFDLSEINSSHMLNICKMIYNTIAIKYNLPLIHAIGIFERMDEWFMLNRLKMFLIALAKRTDLTLREKQDLELLVKKIKEYRDGINRSYPSYEEQEAEEAEEYIHQIGLQGQKWISSGEKTIIKRDSTDGDISQDS